MGQERQIDEGRRFGQFLRSVRENRRLSLDAAAELTSRLPGRVTKSHLSRIENGTAEPTFPRMFSLARVYGVPIAQFAERFEADLRRSMMPANLEAESSAAVFEAAEAMRISGRHDDALIRYELLLERALAPGDHDRPPRSIPALRVRRAACLMRLTRLSSARDEAESLLTSGQTLTPDEHASAIQLFAQCSYHLERYEVALMAMRLAEEVIAKLPEDNGHHAHILQLKANIHFAMQQPKQAAEAFRAAIERYRQLGNDHEVCHHHMNYGLALSECGQHREASRQLHKALKHAESRGYDRVRAYALSGLGTVAYRQGQKDATEAYCLQSNVISRERDYPILVFVNCYYLWKLALARGKKSEAAAHERTLRTLVGRMPGHVAEVKLFRESQMAGGAS